MANLDKIIGIILIVVGALALLGWVGLGWIVTIAAVIALLAGVLMLFGKVNGSTIFAIILIAVGLLLLFPQILDLGQVIGGTLETIAAVVLIILGVLKLMNKW